MKKVLILLFFGIVSICFAQAHPDVDKDLTDHYLATVLELDNQFFYPNDLYVAPDKKWNPSSTEVPYIPLNKQHSCYLAKLNLAMLDRLIGASNLPEYSQLPPRMKSTPLPKTMILTKGLQFQITKVYYQEFNTDRSQYYWERLVFVSQGNIADEIICDNLGINRGPDYLLTQLRNIGVSLTK